VNLPISAIDAIPLAFQHTRRQLTQPFRFGQWWRLALVGFLAGELGSGGGVNFPTNFNFPQTPHSRHFLGTDLPSIDPALMGGAVAVLILAAIVFVLLFMYVGSVMRFILFDSVLVKECRIREGWGRNQGRGLRYFFFKLVYFAVTIFVMVVLVGIPAGIAFALGWFKEPSEHVLGFVLGGVFLFFLFLVLVVVSAVFYVMTKDFVVPQMAFENISVFEGWRRLWPMLEVEKGGYAAYIGMKIVLAIGAGIVVGIATLILALFIAVPAILFGVLAAVTGKSAGLTWDVYTITIAVVVGLVLFGLFMYVISLISVPVIVFFPAYAIYFFAPRYAALNVALYPPPPTPADVASVPPAAPQEPPPLMPGPVPDPIG
jgi:hypothetical protein